MYNLQNDLLKAAILLYLQDVCQEKAQGRTIYLQYASIYLKEGKMEHLMTKLLMLVHQEFP